MTSKLDTEGEAPTERRRKRAFRISMGIGAACFLLANAVLAQWGVHAAEPWRLLLALLPLIPLAWMVIVMVVRARQMDEYQVKQLMPSLAVGFTVTIVAAVVLNTLSSAGFDVPDDGSFLSVVGVVAWAVTYIGTSAAKA
jgi:peptidoglycan/LPS O-acetylase OafA/YrhL